MAIEKGRENERGPGWRPRLQTEVEKVQEMGPWLYRKSHGESNSENQAWLEKLKATSLNPKNMSFVLVPPPSPTTGQYENQRSLSAYIMRSSAMDRLRMMLKQKMALDAQDRSLNATDQTLAQNEAVQSGSTVISTQSPLLDPLRGVLPTLRNPEYYIVPSLVELEKMEAEQPGYCARVKNLVVGRVGYGELWFFGVTDVRGLDLDDIVHLSHCEVRLYGGKTPKPKVGEGLNNPARITYLQVLESKELKLAKTFSLKHRMILTQPLLFSPSCSNFSHDAVSRHLPGLPMVEALERMRRLPIFIYPAIDYDMNLLQFWVPWFVEPQQAGLSNPLEDSQSSETHPTPSRHDQSPWKPNWNAGALRVQEWGSSERIRETAAEGKGKSAIDNVTGGSDKSSSMLYPVNVTQNTELEKEQNIIELEDPEEIFKECFTDFENGSIE